jgi:predicted PurR-regulated permease PerM
MSDPRPSPPGNVLGNVLDPVPGDAPAQLAPADPDANWTAHRLALLALTALALWLCWQVARPFVTSLTWACALAVVAWPLQRHLVRRLRRPGVAALLSCLVVFIVIGVPTTALIPRIAAQAASAFGLARDWVASGGPERLLATQALLAPSWSWLQANVDAGALVQRAGDLAAGIGTSAVQASLEGVLQLTLTVFLLFYFLRDRDAVLRTIVTLLPLSRPEGRALLHEIGDTLYATLVGKVLVSLLQGALGGVMLFILGVPAALFWSVVMAVAAPVPVLGTPVVWIPAALWLAFDGSWIKAAVMLGWGTTVVGMADNLLYPMMVGNRVRLHTVPMLLAMIGGLFVFGMAGFFLGPVLLGATLALLRIWSRRSESEAQAEAEAEADLAAQAVDEARARPLGVGARPGATGDRPR